MNNNADWAAASCFHCCPRVPLLFGSHLGKMLLIRIVLDPLDLMLDLECRVGMFALILVGDDSGLVPVGLVAGGYPDDDPEGGGDDDEGADGSVHSVGSCWRDRINVRARCFPTPGTSRSCRSVTVQASGALPKWS